MVEKNRKNLFDFIWKYYVYLYNFITTLYAYNNNSQPGFYKSYMLLPI